MYATWTPRKIVTNSEIVLELGSQRCLVTDVLRNICFWVLQMKERHTGLK